MILDEAIKSWTSRAGVVRVRNALNPLLWTSGILVPMCWLAAYAFRDDAILKYGFAALGALPILLTLSAYLFFMLRDPDRLQSEEFILRQQELALIARKGAAPPPENELQEIPEVNEVEFDDRARKGEAL